MDLHGEEAADVWEPWQRPWPSEGLESVQSCPVCGHVERNLEHGTLVDNTFRTAPGVWKLWRCAFCRAGYLSPRPTRETIQEAYKRYYTHGGTVVPASAGPASWLQRLGRQLTHGYTNFRYGSDDRPASWLGVVAYALFPARRINLGRQYRHLPRLATGGGTLLDVGCGDGSFLLVAQACGWQVQGLEPDPKAARLAAQQGVPVIEGDLRVMEGRSEVFDVITLSHVIEHVHDPLNMLQACHRLLKPGGRLWLETPNIDSLGHRVFGEYWRGIEAPRHLVLFSRRALLHGLERAGFDAIETLAVPSSRQWIFERSYALSKGRLPDEPVVLPLRLRWRAVLSGSLGWPGPGKGEFLTLGARKSG